MSIKKEVQRTALPEAIMNAYVHTPEHRTLTRLNGDWTIEGEWRVDSGQPVRVGGRMINRGVLGGHFIESICVFEGQEKSRVIYGYDPDEGRFFAFAINAVAAGLDLEYGQYDESADALRFNCVEHVGAKRIPVRFERTISFLAPQGFNLRITYPDFEPDRRLGMELRMRNT